MIFKNFYVYLFFYFRTTIDFYGRYISDDERLKKSEYLFIRFDLLF